MIVCVNNSANTVVSNIIMVVARLLHTGEGPLSQSGPPSPLAVVNSRTTNFYLLLISNTPEGFNERYQNASNAISDR